MQNDMASEWNLHFVICLIVETSETRIYFYRTNLLTVGYFEFIPDDFRVIQVSGNYARKSVTEVYII